MRMLFECSIKQKPENRTGMWASFETERWLGNGAFKIVPLIGNPYLGLMNYHSHRFYDHFQGQGYQPGEDCSDENHAFD